MAPQASKTVFVANIPFDVSEEELANVFSEAGPVSNVEIKFDPNTGKSKGYAFIHFYDEPTAASAVRNLASVEVHGRNLRVELSSDDSGRRDRGRGGGGGGGGQGQGNQGGGNRQMGGRDDGPMYGGYGGAPGPAQGPGPGGYGPPGHTYGGPGGHGTNGPPPVDLNMLPPGQIPQGQRATDAISATLAAVSPGQMQDVMASMKSLIETQPNQARDLLQSKPQLAYALFQAMLLLNIVDASVLQRIQPMPVAPQPSFGGPPNPGYSAPPMGMNQPPYGGNGGGPGGYGAQPPAQGYRPPVPNQSQAAPPPMPAPTPQAAGVKGLDLLPPHAQAALAGLPDDQKTMLIQVLLLSPDAVQTLPPDQRASVVQLRQQFLGTA